MANLVIGLCSLVGTPKVISAALDFAVHGVAPRIHRFQSTYILLFLLFFLYFLTSLYAGPNCPRKSPLLPPEVPFAAPGSPLRKRVVRGVCGLFTTPDAGAIAPGSPLQPAGVCRFHQ
jgi:hypothetical protein